MFYWRSSVVTSATTTEASPCRCDHMIRLCAVPLTGLYSRSPSIGTPYIQHFRTNDANIIEKIPRPYSTTSQIFASWTTPYAHTRSTFTLRQSRSPTVSPPESRYAKQREHPVCHAQCHHPTTANVSGRDWPGRSVIGHIVLVFSQIGVAKLLVGACASIDERDFGAQQKVKATPADVRTTCPRELFELDYTGSSERRGLNNVLVVR
jgi:hypothetical protein